MAIDPRIRQKLLAEIVRQGLSFEKASRMAKLGDTYLRDVFNRDRGKLENVIKVAEAIGKSGDWLLDRKTSAIVIEEPDAALHLRRKSDAPAVAPNASDRFDAPGYGSLIEVIGVARGGADGKLIFNGEVIERIPRPPELEGVDDAYAAYVIGDSMKPRFREGDRVWVHPRRPARKGMDVIVQLFAENANEPPEGYIKEFVSFAGKDLVLSQHNPATELRYKRERVKSVHVIVGALYA